jgi:phosphoglycolate phosphatase-like HAD superfamily hydrolase
VIFDFDGVLVESTDIKTKAFARLFEGEKEEVRAKVLDFHLRNGGVSRFEKFKHIYKNILYKELDAPEMNSLGSRFSEFVVEEVVKAPYVEGAKEFLEEYYRKYDMFVASGTPSEEIRDIVKRRGMERFFKAVYGSPATKTELAKKILSITGVPAKNTVFVGDALSDYEASLNTAINFVVRINENEPLFRNLDCLKIRDLTNLSIVFDTNFNEKKDER